MKTIKFRRFTKPNFLKQIGRDLLGHFFNRFGNDLAEKSIVMPAATLDDDAYFAALAKVAMSPDGLPDNLIEAAYAIEGMANDEGQERLESAVGENGMAFSFREDSTCADIAVQAFLANPEVFAEKFNEQKITRLSSFDYFGSKAPEDRSDSFATPPPQMLKLLTSDFEEVFRAKNRGDQTTRIEVHLIEDEYWFMVRHGDTFARVPTLANGQVSILHFRPATDDVIVYSPERDEIRIHAGRKWEKELYREKFGERLFGKPRHFSERKAYTLEPLRTKGPDALDTDGIEGISRIVLREVEIAWGGEFHDSTIRKSDDVFASGAARSKSPFSDSGKIVHAAFDFYFEGPEKPRKVHVRTPNILKIGRHCDAVLVNQWLSKQEFRINASPQDSDGTQKHENDLALA